jgi:5-amino-6-(5-phospho-D-ribitylamino)uracil phosphatase
MIKLLALDLDGTLLNSSGQISIANKTAVKLAEDSGVLVTIATGRRFRDALPVALELELNAPVVCHNGALIKFADSLEIVHSSIISTQTVLEIIETGKKFGGDALVSCSPDSHGVLLYDNISESNVPLKRYIEWSKRLHGENADSSVHHVDSLEKIISNEEVIHISFSGLCEPMARLQAKLESVLQDSVNIQATMYPKLDFTLLDILPPNCSKASALGHLAEINNLTFENIMAIGDNFNDVQMLEFSQKPIIMGNADETLRQREDFYTTLSNDEDGVAFAINKFILGEN